MMQGLTAWLKQWRSNESSMRQFIGCHLSEPKAHVWFERLAPAEQRLALKNSTKNGLALDRQTRMLWFQSSIFINGESHRADPTLKRFADQRWLSGEDSNQLLKAMPDTLSEWLESGWIHANNP